MVMAVSFLDLHSQSEYLRQSATLEDILLVSIGDDSAARHQQDTLDLGNDIGKVMRN